MATQIHKPTLQSIFQNIGGKIKTGVEKINAISNKIEIIVNNAGINQVSLFQMTTIKKIREVFSL